MRKVQTTYHSPKACDDLKHDSIIDKSQIDLDKSNIEKTTGVSQVLDEPSKCCDTTKQIGFADLENSNTIDEVYFCED